MADSSSTVRLHRSIKQGQDIPSRIRLCISPSARPVENDPRGWLDIMDCLTNATQKRSVVISHDGLLHARPLWGLASSRKKYRNLYLKDRNWTHPAPAALAWRKMLWSGV